MSPYKQGEEMPNKYFKSEEELEAYAEKLRKKAQPQLKLDLINRVFAEAQKAAKEVLATCDSDEKWALEQALAGKSIEEFFKEGQFLGLDQQKLWVQIEAKKT